MHDSELIIALFLLIAAVVTGLGSKIGRWYISMPMVFVLAGILVGPRMSEILSVYPASDFVQLLAEVTLALILFADASTLSLREASDDAQLPGRLLAFGLPLTIVLGGIAGKILYPELSIGYALLIAAILAPTDASLGLPVYTNPSIPVRIRRALNIESGLNDGIASPIVLLFLALTLSEEGITLGNWLSDAAVELFVAILVGLAIGVAGGKFLETAVDRRWTSSMWSKLAIFAVALASYFLSVALGGNGFVAAFVGGIFFGHASHHKLAEQTEFTEANGSLLAMLVWTIFAAIFVTPELLDYAMRFDARAILYVILSLTVVRMLPVAISMIGSGLRRDTVLIMGWFGPRGLASVVFAVLAVAKFREYGLVPEPLATVVTLTIMFSVFAHGFSAQPLVNWYARRLEEAEDGHVELEEMPEMRPRSRMLTAQKDAHK